MMLDTLRRISQEVNNATTLQAALDTLVRRVRDAMGTEVCSIYLLNDSGDRYTLMASEGLKTDAIGKASLGIAEGLVGQVGLREEPINLENAFEHPRFAYLAETGEEEFHAFLGVPIIHQKRILGVLVVQQRDKRRFDQSEEAFLVTVSAQLAPVVAIARTSGALKEPQGAQSRTTSFQGISSAKGAAIGQVRVIYPVANLQLVPERFTENPDQEVSRLETALMQVRIEIRRLKDKTATTLPPEELALFDVYLRMLDKHALAGEISDCIRNRQLQAESALREVIQTHEYNFSLMDDPYLRERAADVRDLGLRVLAALQNEHTQQAPLAENTILAGEDIPASVLADAPPGSVAGIITTRGSSNSHLSIIARALGIPTVVGVQELPLDWADGKHVIVDGYRGLVICNPNEEMTRQYEDIIAEEKLLMAGLEPQRDLPAITTDGHSVAMFVNTGLMADIHRSLDRGAEGVGLYRTEIPFMVRERFPSEEEQRQIYRAQLEAFAPRPVTMRTLDVGGDKALPYFPIEEDNPFLGWRGIRITLDHPEIFMVQVRAMIRASEGLNNLRIMLPMIATVIEVEEAQHLVHRAWLEIREEGLDVELPPVGVMIEVPAAVYQATELASRVDFLSVGSNDLIQYLLAVDRNNPRVSNLYKSYHPAVLLALKQVAEAAHREDKPVSICGEMAGDPAGALLLLAMGYDSLSMSAAALPRIKWIIRNLSLTQAQDILAQALTMDNAEVIRAYLNLELEKLGLANLLPA